MSNEVIVTIIGLALIAFVLWFFLGGSLRSGHDHSKH
jgi:plastocyanin domain-containing protein